MKINRPAFVLGGLIACLLFLSADKAAAQEVSRRGYFFVEVKDTAGQKITDADINVSYADKRETFHLKTDENGRVETRFYTGYSTLGRHYDLRVSNPGCLPYEQVFFVYPDKPGTGDEVTQIAWIDELFYSDEALRAAKSRPATLVLRKLPTTPAEGRAVELDERKHQLLLAAKRGDPVNLRKWLQAGVNANTTDAKGVPAIAWAALAGDAETIMALLDAGADVSNKNSPAHQALLIYLLEGIQHARAAPKSYTTGTPVLLAEREELVRRLIAAGASVIGQSAYKDPILNAAIMQPLNDAYRPDSITVKIVKRLIDAGAKVNMVGPEGQTSLMLAAQKRSPELVNMLLKAGARAFINAQDQQGRTALMYAPNDQPSGSAIVSILVAAGSRVNVASQTGETALMAAARANSPQAAQALLAAGAAVNAQDKQGRTALMYASQAFASDVTKALIEAGAPVDEKDAQGWTALMYAPTGWGDFNQSRLQVVRTLIAAGANPNAVNANGETVLMIAGWSDFTDVFKEILESGAAVNARDKRGQTVLMWAAQVNSFVYIERIKLLLAAGADVSLKDNQGQTALMLARKAPLVSTVIVNLLIDAESRR